MIYQDIDTRSEPKTQNVIMRIGVIRKWMWREYARAHDMTLTDLITIATDLFIRDTGD